MSRQAMPVQSGAAIDYKNTGSTVIKAGDIVPLNSLCGIAETDIAPEKSGAVALTGVWDICATPTCAFTVGQVVFWDEDNGYATDASDGHSPLGIVTKPKESDSGVCRVKIGTAVTQSATAVTQSATPTQ